MAGLAGVSARSINWFRVVARVLVGGWVAVIGVIVVSFMVAGLGKPFRWDGYLFCVLALLGLGGCAVLTWRREKAGGVALLVIGLGVMAMGYVRPPGGLADAGLLEAMALTALPPLLAGVLLLVSVLRDQRRPG